MLALGAGAIVAPLAAHAQPTGRMRQVGWMRASIANEKWDTAFKNQLQERGWTEGQNIIIERRFGESDPQRIRDFIAEMVARKADLIIAGGTPVSQVAKTMTLETPVVFMMVSDPVASGLVASLARPGGNMTGISNNLPESAGKLLELLKSTHPAATRFAVMRDPGNHGKVLEVKEIQAAARKLRVTVQVIDAAPSNVEPAFAAISRAHPAALIVLLDGASLNNMQRIVAFAAKARLPAIYQIAEFVEDGGLMSYGLNVSALYRRVADYVDRVLRGAKPADLPVELPDKPELVFNMKTAKALGIKIPDTVLLRADRVIE